MRTPLKLSRRTSTRQPRATEACCNYSKAAAALMQGEDLSKGDARFTRSIRAVATHCGL
jgi:hypothetical protein